MNYEMYAQQGLPRKFWRIASSMDARLQPVAPLNDIGMAYLAAKARSDDFKLAMAKLAKRLKCKHACRPGMGFKNPDRILEKYARSGEIPTDILGVKLIAASVNEMYALAGRIPQEYQVVQFKDRIVEPQQTGYRDLQFTIGFAGLAVELKICHQSFDEIDTIEHKVYEITRSFKDGQNIPRRQEDLLKALVKVSQSVYTQTWQETLVKESGDW